MKLGLGLGFAKGGGFSPLAVSGLQIWLDPTNTSTIADGTDMTITDLSGNGRNGTATGANKPTTGTNTINGFNAIRFQSDSMTVAYNSALFGADGEFTAFAVINDLNIAASYRAWFGQYGASGNRRFLVGYNVSPSFLQLTTSANGIAFSGVTRRQSVASNTPLIIGIRKNQGSGLAEFFYNGTLSQAALATALFGSNANVSIGSDGSAGNKAADMLFGQLLWYNKCLSDAEMDYIGSGLGSKFNILWAKKSETLIFPGGSQSNDTLPFTVGGGYDEEGLDAFNASAPTYGYKRYEALNTSTSGYPLLVDNSSPPTSYGYVTSGGTAGPAFTNYYSANLASTVNGKSVWGNDSIVDYVRLHGCEGDVTDTKTNIKTKMGDLIDLLVAKHGSHIKGISYISPTYDLAVTDEEWQAVREGRSEGISEHANGIPWAYQFETYHRARADDQHFAAASFTAIFQDFTQLCAFLDGRSSPIVEPQVTGVTYSGDTVTITTDAPSLSGTEYGIFRITDDGTPATISDMDITDGVITLTLSAPIASSSDVLFWVNWGKGDTWYDNRANLPFDSNGRPIKTVWDYPVTEA